MSSRFALLAAVLLAVAGTAGGELPSSIGPAIDAIRANDCAVLGQVVNRGIDQREPGMLYVAGMMFEDGYCVEIDRARAARFYRAAEEKGDLRAAAALGLAYALGDGLPRSYSRAAPFLRHAYALVRRDQGPGPSEWRIALPRPLLFDEPHDEVIGYLVTLYWIVTASLEYDGQMNRTGFESEAHVKMCPDRKSIDVSFSNSDGRLRASTEQAVREKIERAYEKAQRAAPRPGGIDGSVGCAIFVVVFTRG